MQIGIDGINKNIIDGYIGVDGVNKQLKQVLIGVDGVNKEVWANVQQVPRGTIVVWSGTTEEIPEGWLLCDGNNGTPNLIDRFVMGGTSSGATGGCNQLHSHTLTSAGSHTHAVSGGAHRHSISAYGGLAGSTSSRYYTSYDGNHTHDVQSSGGHTHDMSAEESMPRYYALAFIMKG